VGDALSAAAALLPGVRIEKAGMLRRTKRSEVLRVRVVRPGDARPEMLIVKMFPDAFGAELAARSGGTVPESAMPGLVTGAVSALTGLCDEQDVALAATGWAFVSVSWFLGAALGEDRPLHDAAAGLPTRRAVILHLLGNARNAVALPALAEFATRLRADLARRWGEVPLQIAPAFRPSGVRQPPG
jgi:hypothetical protein